QLLSLAAASTLIIGNLAWGQLSPVLAEAGSELDAASLELSPSCQAAIDANQPSLPGLVNDPDRPDLRFEVRGHQEGWMGVTWSHITGQFYDSPEAETAAAQAIGRACPELWFVFYEGATGGTLRWYMRQTEFAFKHRRDSGLPGDFDRYWRSGVPYDYDPHRDYFDDLTGAAILPGGTQTELPAADPEGSTDYRIYRESLLARGWQPNFPNSYIPGLPELACGNRFCTALFISSDRQTGLRVSVGFRRNEQGEDLDLFVLPDPELEQCGTTGASC
ncbi:MAG: hypothetical protein EA367_15805, partial [Leptolyngbya sp. DLM2.Bin15]